MFIFNIYNNTGNNKILDSFYITNTLLCTVINFTNSYANKVLYIIFQILF